jgi:hypothetical protein
MLVNLRTCISDSEIIMISKPASESRLGGKVMEVMVVMNWEVMNLCSIGSTSNEVVIDLQNDHVVMKMTHVVMM